MSIAPVSDMSLLHRRNRRVMRGAAAVAIASLGMGFAAVPLYRMFCQTTGYGGTTMRADPRVRTVAVAGKTMSIRFDSNVTPGMPWQFYPEHRTDTVSVGARDMAIFVARNDSEKEITGTATFNVTPDAAGAYFSKIQCFCFTQQTLKPHQEIRMPVIYFVDPKILKDPEANKIQEITLSYTFYPVEPDAKQR
jgi:cytochrome c oxidase assembly protein subunit 11